MSMSVRATDRRRHARPAVLALLLAVGLGGCATQALESASAKLREGIERDLTPATERLARRTGEQLIASLVAELEGPLNKRLLEAGQDMSKSLIKGAALGFSEPGNQDSFGTLTYTLHESEELKAAIQPSAHDNDVGPWLSTFLKRRGL
jgi:hypothetical protein